MELRQNLLLLARITGTMVTNPKTAMGLSFGGDDN
jgi:hypothetical protein